MEKNKEIRIKLTTIIIFAVLIGFLILVMLLSNFDSKNTDMNNVVIENQISNTITGNEVTNEVEFAGAENMEDSFYFEFLKMENQNVNMLYSPLSIKYALSMLSEGASGNTKIQIDNIISRLNVTKYNNIEKILSLANALYIRDTYKQSVKEDFKNTLVDRYGAQLKYDSFSDAKNINTWIKNKTFGILENIVEDSIVQQSELLLINALAIDMKWVNEFSDNGTHGKEFTLYNGEKVYATTMNEETCSENVSYYKDDNITAVAMDLEKQEGVQLEFFAVMPDKNLDEYVKTVTNKEINDITTKLIKASDTKKGIDISIPKFEFDYGLNLKEDLQKLGIEDAFDREKSNFSNITDNKLYVGEAVHKADIKFSEEGIRAAAVTVFAMETSGIFIEEEDKPIEVKIDKPFLFLIRDKENGEIWFTGTVYEPNLWEKDKGEYSREKINILY